jgi:hypothetical protein
VAIGAIVRLVSYHLSGRTTSMRAWLGAIVCGTMLLGCAGGRDARAAEPLIRLQLGQEWFEGTPLAASKREVAFLTRDGRRIDFAPDDAKNFSKLSGSFRSLSSSELRGQLLREFGRGYDVSGAGHYLVVHPAGQRDQWAPRFEQLYRSFVHYFTVRGWRPTEPRFPLVAVVYPRQVDFQQQAAREGIAAGAGLLGYYSPQTNRILLFDSRPQTGDWTVNAETIIHEAAHQVAFNTGIHSRFGQSPRWVVEGLGTMFEAPGVWDSRQHTRRSDRVNQGRFESYLAYAQRRRHPSALAELVSSDRPFQADIDGAYAEAWALTFFLCETQPKKYLDYLAQTAAARPFEPYPAPKRLADFTQIFGTDLKMLDARMQRFLAGLK